MRTVLFALNFCRLWLTTGRTHAALQAHAGAIRIESWLLRERIKDEARAARQTELGLYKAISRLQQNVAAVAFHRQQLEDLDPGDD